VTLLEIIRIRRYSVFGVIMVKGLVMLMGLCIWGHNVLRITVSRIITVGVRLY
jgi:hypothetical protein